MTQDRTRSIAVEEQIEDGQGAGIEAELPDPDSNSLGIERPFDPDKIKVARETKTISLLSTRIDHEEIDLAPEFQRRARIWDPGRKSRLIESILLRIPLPVFYVASDAQEAWSVVDGLQRLTTIHDFMKGHFVLNGLEYLVQFERLHFNDLPRNMQRRIEETELVVNIIQPGTPEEVMFNIFSRINTGGLTLNAQEIRHALNKGPARSFLKDLAESKAFLRATVDSVSDLRMTSRECALRFLAFYMTSWHDYSANDLDGFLNAAMQRLNHVGPSKLREYRSKFDDAMDTAYEIFGRDSFRKRYSPEANRNPISKALFEVWSVTLAMLDETQRVAIMQRKNLVQEAFIELMVNDREFEVAVSYSTGSPGRVHKRFESISNLVVKVLQS
jgi:hypothetical protein